VGFLDFLTGGSGPEKALKLKPKVTQKYGDPATRQKAIHTLGDMKTPEAVAVLMMRYTIMVDPHTTDADEKDTVFGYICSVGGDAVAPVKDFLRKSESASSWAIKILAELVSPEELIGIVCEELHRLGTEYTRDPEKKTVLLNFVEDKRDPRIAPEVLLLLDDPADDVKLASLRALAPLKYEPAREPILKVLIEDETAKRVQTACINTLAESAFTVQGYREKVEKRLSEGWFIDGAGALKKRGAA
jgi:HEAT repeat protein